MYDGGYSYYQLNMVNMFVTDLVFHISAAVVLCFLSEESMCNGLSPYKFA